MRRATEMDRRLRMTLSEQLSRPDPAIRDGDGGGGTGGAINWKPLRDQLWLRRAATASAWTTSNTPPASMSTNRAGGNSSSSSNGDPGRKLNCFSGETAAATAFSRTFSCAPLPFLSRPSSTSATTSARPAVAEHDDDGGKEDYGEEEEEEPAGKMSLMALLEQTDSQWDDHDDDGDEDGDHGGSPKNSATAAALNDDDDELEAREEEPASVCCVCVARRKGAAFVPCGHTFCRRCSGDLRAARGRCPLCNGVIQEILHLLRRSLHPSESPQKYGLIESPARTIGPEHPSYHGRV